MLKQLLNLTFLFLAIAPRFAAGQQFTLVKDINPGTVNNGPSLDDGVTFKDLFFYKQASQLYRTDGTLSGTFVLTDLIFSEYNEITQLVAGSKHVYFAAFYQNNYQLFRSDGTRAGTFPLHLTSGVYDAPPLDINGTVYFSGAAQFGTLELWKTDGSVAGTTLVKSLDTNTSDVEGIVRMVNYNGILYFMVRKGFGSGTTYAWWKSDGTAAGTVRTPINFSQDFEPVVMGNYLYFTENGALKRTDGTTITTVRQGFTSINGLSALGSALYFSANDGVTGVELWKSDGTTAGTALLKDINPGNATDNFYINIRAVLNGTLYFLSPTPGKGVEVWKTNGTTAGTVRVSDVDDDPATSRLSQLLVVGNQLAFLQDGQDSQTLWKTDGTPAGTSQVTTLSVRNVRPIGNLVLFNTYINGGSPLYKSDLTPAGTVPVSQPTPLGSNPSQITDVNGTAFFLADDGVHGSDLWKSNGTAAGTVFVNDVFPGTRFPSLQFSAKTSNSVYFLTNLNAIWKSDGTSGGTIKLKDVSANPSGSNRIFGITAVNDVVFFGVQEDFETTQLWKTDGTVAGTVELKSFPQTYEFRPIAYKGNLYFGAYDGMNGGDLWKSDGTTAGTVLVKDAVPDLGWQIFNHTMVVAGDYLYYGNNSSSGYKLFRTDGTSAGTVLVRDFVASEFGDQTVSNLYTAGGLVYLSLLNGDDPEILWRSNGTSAGTFPLASFDVQPEYGDPYIRHLTDAGGKLFFVPYDAEEGDQLWVTDGTVAGTRQLNHIEKDPTAYEVRFSAVIGNIFYYTQFDPATGIELWRSDGTEEGTYLLVDFNSAPGGSSNFTGLANVNGSLLLGVAGELYKYQPSATATAAVRLNSGGAAFNASGSRAFSADQYFAGTTSVSNAASGDILNTTDDQLYREQRFGTAFSYAIPIANGPVSVVLHFAEIYWGVPSRSGTSGANKRKFHVDIEGARKLTNYDIFNAAGGAMRAKTETFMVTVTDGMLNIYFNSGSADKPLIAAIEVLPGSQMTLEPVADAYIRNTPNAEINYGSATTLEVKAGSLPSYQRKSYLRFSLAGVSQVSAAKLRIYGSNVQNSTATALSVFGVEDDNWTENGIAWFNAPAPGGAALQTVSVNNTAKYYEMDVTAYVRSQLSGNKVVSLLLTNPADQNAQLVFNSRENAANRPQLVLETSGSAREGVLAEAVYQEKSASVLYPNPVGKEANVHFSDQHKGKVNLVLTNAAGQSVYTDRQGVVSNNRLLNLKNTRLQPGIYLLKIESETYHEVLRVFIE